MPAVYERPPSKRWNTSLRWKKSGTESAVTGDPFEIWEKFYGPTILPASSKVLDALSLSLQEDLSELTSHRRFHPSHLIQISINAVAGQRLEDQNAARRAYRNRRGNTGRWTQRLELRDMGDLMRQLRERLLEISELPSTPSWLVSVSVHIYFDEGEGDNIHIPRYAEVRKI